MATDLSVKKNGRIITVDWKMPPIKPSSNCCEEFLVGDCYFILEFRDSINLNRQILNLFKQHHPECLQLPSLYNLQPREVSVSKDVRCQFPCLGIQLMSGSLWFGMQKRSGNPYTFVSSLTTARRWLIVKSAFSIILLLCCWTLEKNPTFSLSSKDERRFQPILSSWKEAVPSLPPCSSTTWLKFSTSTDRTCSLKWPSAWTITNQK